MLRIGIDARELMGDVTGVGRYLGEILTRWTARADSDRRQFYLYAPEPLPLTFAPEHDRDASRWAGFWPRHVVGADASPPRHPPGSARRLLRSGVHGAARRRDADGRDHPRHLIRRSPRVVSSARRPAPAVTDAARGARGRRCFHRLGVLQVRARNPARRHAIAHRRHPARRHLAERAPQPNDRRGNRWCSSSARCSTAGGCRI